VKGTIKPTKAQIADAKQLGSQVAWNDFGTPSSLVNPGSALGATVAGSSAVDAARTWLDRNKALFKLSSTAGLALASDSKLTGIDAHAVSLQQTLNGLAASGGGLVTLGVMKAAGGWKVVSASSTINGDETLAGKPKLAPEQGWQRAAKSVGVPRSVRQVHRARAAKAQLHGWKSLKVAGISDVQRTRAVAFPTVADGFVPAYESIVVDSSGGEPLAYRVFTDARSGKVLARESLVDKASEAAAAAPVFNFSGEVPATEGACDTMKGPYTVAAGDNVRALDVFASADLFTNDIVLNLYAGTTLLTSADTGTSPERIRYEPSGGVPAGDYFVQVCDFVGQGVWQDPRTYTGSVTFDTSAAPAPYLARWDLFPANPPLNTLASDPWNNPSTDTRQEWCWKASTNAADCNRVAGNLASRTPWDVDGKTGAATNTTMGNNASTGEQWKVNGPGPNPFRPMSSTRDYTFPWTNQWFTTDCNVPDRTVGESVDISAAVTNLFTMHNRMHDWSYLLGFTEDNWNAQSSNFGLTEAFRENDPVTGDAQAAAFPPAGATAQRNNANMTTLPDGSPSYSNMYLWQPQAGAFYPPCVDGDFDAGIIGHEYTHMIENRTIGKGANRSGSHAGDMGEAVGDLFAIELLNEYGFVPTSDENRWAEGAYATGNKLRGIRDYAGNFPYTGAFPTPSTNPQVDPLNFSDIGFDVTGPEVHADGEIWIATNFEIRRALAAKYNAQFPESDQALQTRCADGAQPVNQCPGNRRWIQLLFDSFLLDPIQPSMVDARDMMLAADQMRFGGANQNELWGAFARRGLGQAAFSTTGTGRANGVEKDSDPLPDFGVPGGNGNNAVVHFAAVSRQAPEPAINARIFVGHYEARVSPVADTDPATSAPANPKNANNLDETGDFAPGTYEFVATAPGYGEVRFRRTFRAGQEQTITLHLAPNWASKSQGSTASGDSTAVNSPTTGNELVSAAAVRNNLIDDSEGTDWQASATQTGPSWEVDGKQVTVDLGGSSPVRINRVQVSAMLGLVFDPGAAPRPADLTFNRFTAVRRFEIDTCNARVADCSQDDSYQRAYLSPADAFPSEVPRPVAPTLLMREFTFSPVQATNVRLVVHSSQCTGGPAYQGEQDNDPNNATDCNEAGSAATRFVRVAELQAFSQPSTVSVATG
jgi:hypothetical protein